MRLKFVESVKQKFYEKIESKSCSIFRFESTLSKVNFTVITDNCIIYHQKEVPK
ncbi:hypothetical protein LEP1GSC041_0885 [Leptospira noguchii str. 2006001870]|nr:hypothetical protein LEP1GSC041_0885 [Leptospira noguchii str. 2006001870]